MLVSHVRKFIFIHIQKTAGSSIETSLADITPDAIRRFDDLPACMDPLKKRHLFASDLKRYLGDQTWKSYYKFAFVRNPYSRLVSWYNMCVERPSNEFMWLVRQRAKTFSDFLDLTHGLAKKTTFNQVDYITNETGNFLVDFVGRFETLSEDFSKICKQLDVNVTLPHKSRGLVVDYRAFYNTRTMRLVSERFSRDIETFGYKFE